MKQRFKGIVILTCGVIIFFSGCVLSSCGTSKKVSKSVQYVNLDSLSKVFYDSIAKKAAELERVITEVKEEKDEITITPPDSGLSRAEDYITISPSGEITVKYPATVKKTSTKKTDKKDSLAFKTSNDVSVEKQDVKQVKKETTNKDSDKKVKRPFPWWIVVVIAVLIYLFPKLQKIIK